VVHDVRDSQTMNVVVFFLKKNVKRLAYLLVLPFYSFWGLALVHLLYFILQNIAKLSMHHSKGGKMALFYHAAPPISIIRTIKK